MADAKLALAVAAPVATPCRAPLAALQAPIWQCIHASAERRREELEAEAAAALKRSKRKSEKASRSSPKRRRKAKSGRDRQRYRRADCGYSWRRCWQQALTPGHELSPINSEDFDRLWEGFEQQEVKDIFTASEAEPCAARSSSAAPKQDEVQPKQGEAGRRKAVGGLTPSRGIRHEGRSRLSRPRRQARSGQRTSQRSRRRRRVKTWKASRKSSTSSSRTRKKMCLGERTQTI